MVPARHVSCVSTIPPAGAVDGGGSADGSPTPLANPAPTRRRRWRWQQVRVVINGRVYYRCADQKAVGHSQRNIVLLHSHAQSQLLHAMITAAPVTSNVNTSFCGCEVTQQQDHNYVRRGFLSLQVVLRSCVRPAIGKPAPCLQPKGGLWLRRAAIMPLRGQAESQHGRSQPR
jgi:hypothetical protein